MLLARELEDGVVLAESDDKIIVEGNHCFPLDSVKRELMSGSDTHTHCSWKGDASYYNVSAGGERKPATPPLVLTPSRCLLPT